MACRTVSTIVCGDYTSISDNSGFTMCISTEGNVSCFGNLYNEMESINKHCHSFPSLRNIKAIDCSDYHLAFLDENGTVFTMGSNSYGQLGINLYNTLSSIPQQLHLPQMKQISCREDSTI